MLGQKLRVGVGIGVAAGMKGRRWSFLESKTVV